MNKIETLVQNKQWDKLVTVMRTLPPALQVGHLRDFSDDTIERILEVMKDSRRREFK